MSLFTGFVKSLLITGLGKLLISLETHLAILYYAIYIQFCSALK